MILEGREIRERIKDSTLKLIDSSNKSFKLATIRLGDNPGDKSYEKGILKYTSSLNIDTKPIVLDVNIPQEELLYIIEELNLDDEITGILIFRPLPSHIQEDVISKSIDPLKDVDGMHPDNLSKLFLGKDGYKPCTALSVMEFIKYFDISLEGKDVLIINRTMVLGKPLWTMMLDENSTITIAHSKTYGLKEKCKSSDIVITGMGRAKMLDKSYFSEDSIVLDVGMSLGEDGNYSGDVDFDNVKDYVRYITPVFGGVGSITTAILIRQMIEMKLKL